MWQLMLSPPQNRVVAVAIVRSKITCTFVAGGILNVVANWKNEIVIQWDGKTEK